MTLAAASRSIPGVLFAEDFDDDALVIDAPRNLTHEIAAGEPPDPGSLEIQSPSVFSQAQLSDAERLAREAGRTEGWEAHRSSIATERVIVLERLATELAAGSAEVRAIAMAQADEVARAIFAVVVTCLPALCETHATAEMLRTLHLVLPPLVDEPEILVTVHPDQRTALSDELAGLSIASGRMRVEVSPLLGRGDVRVVWKNGKAESNAADLQARVVALLADSGLLPASTSQQQEGTNVE